jgi:hypothetical protein
MMASSKAAWKIIKEYINKKLRDDARWLIQQNTRIGLG